MLEPGDFLLFHGKALYSRLIGFGERLPFTHPDPRYAWWTHAAVIEIPDPRGLHAIIEAQNDGVRRRTLTRDDLNPAPVGVHVPATTEQRSAMLALARSCLGAPYNWLAVASIALHLATAGDLAVEQDGRYICSGVVATSLAAAGITWPRPANQVMPADLAARFGVLPPAFRAKS